MLILSVCALGPDSVFFRFCLQQVGPDVSHRVRRWQHICHHSSATMFCIGTDATLRHPCHAVFTKPHRAITICITRNPSCGPSGQERKKNERCQQGFEGRPTTSCKSHPGAFSVFPAAVPQRCNLPGSHAASAAGKHPDVHQKKGWIHPYGRQPSPLDCRLLFVLPPGYRVRTYTEEC